MAYQTGVSSGPADLLNKLKTFALANGWLVNGVSGGEVFRKNGIVCGAATTADEIQLRGAITYNSGAAWDAQTNAATVTSRCNCGAGPFPSYHFYAGDEGGREHLSAVIQIAAGVFRHLFIGQLVKSGAYTGGTYIHAQWHQPGTFFAEEKNHNEHRMLADASSITNLDHVWVDADGRTNSWSIISNVSNFNPLFAVGSRRSGFGFNALQIGHARYSLRSIIAPLYIEQNRASNLRSIIGYLPNVRAVNMQQIAVGSSANIGGDDFDFWPMTTRSDNGGAVTQGVPSSGWYGLAYKHIA